MPQFRNLIAGAAALACAVLAAGPAAAQSKPPIKIAHSAALSGPIASIGKLQQIAIRLAVEDINKAGGVNGSLLEVQSYDDQFKPDQGVLRIREAQGAGAVVVIGPISSTQWETAVPVLNQLKMPGININANKAGINKPPYAMRIAQPDDVCLPIGLDEFLKATPNVKRVAVIGDVREAAGKAAVDLWSSLARARGIEVADQLSYTTGQADLSPLAIRLKELKVDAVLVSMLVGDAAKLARDLQIQGVKAPVLANALIYPGTFPQVTAKSVGADAAQWHVVGYATNDASTGDPARYKSFVERYIAEVNKDAALAQFQPPNVANTSIGYDVIYIVADLLRRKGVDGAMPPEQQRERLREAMGELKSWRGVTEYNCDGAQNCIPQTRVLRVDGNRSMWVLAK
jgi:branched-chain amino acid transport system substrate-binding protein